MFRFFILLCFFILDSEFVVASSIVSDTSVVDTHVEKSGLQYKMILPLIDTDTGRYSANIYLNQFKTNSNRNYSTIAHITKLTSLNDSTDIVVDKGFNPDIASKLKSFLLKNVSEYGKPGVILRVDINGKVWRGVAGKRRFNSDELLNFSDRHRIGSLTKTFVDSTIMQLVDQGVLSLDDTIDKYIPDVEVPNKSKITIRHLIAHRTGLFNYVVDFNFTGIQKALAVDPLKVYSPNDLLSIANSHPVNHEPGERYQYSNTGLILAGLIIEKLTGKSISTAIHEFTVNKLGLLRTEFPTDPGIQSNYMHGHADYNGDGIISSYNGSERQTPYMDPNNGLTIPAFPAQEVVSYMDPSVSWAAGAMISNHEDLAMWMKSYVDGDLLRHKALQNNVLSDCFPSAPDYGASYCLGIVKLTWPFNTTDPNKWWFGHLGQINGYDNAVFRNPRKNITIGMTNNNYFIGTDSNLGTGVLIFELLDIVDPISSSKKMHRGLIDNSRLNPEDLGGQ